MTTRIGKFLVAMLLLAAVPAHAQLFRTYLAIDGSDANPCTLPLPCRLLPAALAAVADGGEVWMLDSGNYNTTLVTVTKSVTILAVPGALGSLVGITGGAVQVAAAGLTVTLQNLNIRPLPGEEGGFGVIMTGNSTLRVVRSSVFGFGGGWGLYAGNGRMIVSDCELRDNGRGIEVTTGAAAHVSDSRFSANFIGGSAVAGTAVPTTLTVSRAAAASNSWGFVAEASVPGSTARVFVTDSAIEGHNNAGVAARNPGDMVGAVAHATVSNTLLVNNNAALRSDFSGSRVHASGNTLTHNSTAFLVTGAGLIESAGNNAVRNNTSDGTAPTIIAPM